MTSNPEQTVWLVRHGAREDVANPTWRQTAARPYDPPLSDQGHADARRLARRLVGERIDAIYTSPFLRAVQTAAAVAAAVDAPIRLEPGLGEWLRKDWFDGVPVLMPAVDTGFACDHMDWTYRSPWTMSWPEQWEDVMVRIDETMRRLLAAGDSFVLVGHGATVIGSAAVIMGGEAPHDPPPPPTTSLSRFDRRADRWRAAFEADTAHLETPAPPSI